MDGKWLQYRRAKIDSDHALVSIRRNTIAFNAAFVKLARLKEKCHVQLFTKPDEFRLGFTFGSDRGDYSYRLTQDGGKHREAIGGLCITVQAFFKDNRWLRAVAENSRAKFSPNWDSIDKKWVVALCPAFENRVSDKSEIPSDAIGIYRYKREAETVYIGRGKIRSRLSAPERADWDFEIIEYSLLSDTSQQEHWESYWLDQFVQEKGRLPQYNRISGKQVASADMASAASV